MTTEKTNAQEQWDFDRSIGFLIGDVSRLMRRDFGRLVKGLGLTTSQWLVLVFLYRDDGQTQTELAAEVDMERAPLGRIVDRLEENGWVTRRGDEKDRRVNRIYLTNKLEPLMEDLRQVADDLYEATFRGIAQKDLDRLIDVLQKAKSNLL